MKKEVRDILTGMKAELSKGWIKGALIREDGVCLYGALVKTGNIPYGRCSTGETVAGRSNSSAGTYLLQSESPEWHVTNMLAAEVGETWQTLALWNDAPERTVDDITNAIDRLLTRGQPLKKNARKRLRRTKELVPA